MSVESQGVGRPIGSQRPRLDDERVAALARVLAAAEFGRDRAGLAERRRFARVGVRRSGRPRAARQRGGARRGAAEELRLARILDDALDHRAATHRGPVAGVHLPRHDDPPRGVRRRGRHLRQEQERPAADRGRADRCGTIARAAAREFGADGPLLADAAPAGRGAGTASRDGGRPRPDGSAGFGDPWRHSSSPTRGNCSRGCG